MEIYLASLHTVPSVCIINHGYLFVCLTTYTDSYMFVSSTDKRRESWRNQTACTNDVEHICLIHVLFWFCLFSINDLDIEQFFRV